MILLQAYLAYHFIVCGEDRRLTISKHHLKVEC